MKKLLIFLSFIALFSCEKPHCKECIRYYWQTSAHKPVIIQRFVTCDNEPLDARPTTWPMTYTVCK